MNFGTPVPLLLGIILIVSAIGLFFLDRLKPGYERDSDKVYAILSLISGLFLLGNLTMELIPAFQQIIMVGMYIALMVQNIGSRSPRDSRPMPQASYEGPAGRPGYRPGRSNRPPARPYGQQNVRAELDRERIAPDSRFSPAKPMLGSRDGRPYDDYDYREARDRYDEPSRRPAGRLSPSKEPRPPYYGPAERGWSEDRSGESLPGAYPGEGEARRPRRPPENRPPFNEANGPGDRPEKPLNVRPYREAQEKRPGEGDYVNYRPVDPTNEPKDSSPDYGNNY